MTDKTAPKETPWQRRRRVIRAWRLRAIVRTIPKTTTGRNVARYFRYAAAAVGQNRRRLARTVYPWQPRPVDPRVDPRARVLRGLPR